MFLSLLQLVNVAEAAVPQGNVQTIDGRLTARRGGSAAVTLLARNSVLYAGDIVATGPGSKATLFFKDGSKLYLNANSAIQITVPIAVKGKRILFRLLRGEVSAHPRPGRAVQIGTVYAGARGTVFQLRLEADGTTTVIVIEGEVDFWNQYGEVVVGESQQSMARPGAAPTTPVTIANPGLIIEWTLDLERAIIPREKFYISLDRRVVNAQLPRRAELARGQPTDVAARRDYGDALFDSGRFADALTEYQAADHLPPRPEYSHATTLTRLGYTFLELDRLDEAEASFSAAQAGATESEHAADLVGVAALELARDRPDAAHEAAVQAVAADARSSEAQIALGLALMRQPGQSEAAAQAFNAALAAEPAAYHYQARAWLALVYLAQDDQPAALREVQAAAQMAPQSGLAHGNLALVYFFAGKADAAVREARLATHLNPNAVAARVALGQALLAQGDVDEATQVAAQAVALDPKLAQAHYLLGTADAQRRDYKHAARSLEQALRLAPEFIPAASALARVYNRMGRSTQAIKLLTDLLPRHRNADAVRAALGEVYYEQGQYSEAVAQYEEAARLKPDSALNYAGLARLSLDANRLNEAISAGQKAVQLAPEVGQYHAILALAYDYSRLDAQAEREYRTALALDPQNALALVRLAVRNQEGDPRTTQRTTGNIFAQGFLYDPAISGDLLRGGVDTELAARGGADDRGVTVVHRERVAEGQLHFFGHLNRDADNGDRANDHARQLSAQQDTTYILNPHTNLYFHALHSRANGGVAGMETAPDRDDRRTFRFNQGIVAARQRIGTRGYLWAGLFGRAQHEDRTNPDQNASFIEPAVDAIVAKQGLTSRADIPELRLDLALGRVGAGSATLTFGVARPHATVNLAEDLLIRNPAGPGTITLEQDNRVFLAYTQLAQRFNSHGSFIGQLRYQRFNRTNTGVFESGLVTQPFSNAQAKSYLLPSLVTSYQINRSSLLRLSMSRRVTDVVSSVFAPAGTLLTTEGQILPTGLPDPGLNGDLRTVELDAERYLSAGGLLKVFLFHTTGRHLIYDFSDFSNPSDLEMPGTVIGGSLNLDRVERTGFGVRYERQLQRNLFGQVMGSINRTTNVTADMPFSGGLAPYHPRLAAGMSLHYITASGNKIGLAIQYTGSFFADTGDPAATVRPRFPAAMTVDLLLAREPSVHNEIFLQVTNLFNVRQIVFNDIPRQGRRVRIGLTQRF